jgi:hypothetical protein
MLMRMVHRHIERLIDDGHWSPTDI